jgi:hypothetical protein
VELDPAYDAARRVAASLGPVVKLRGVPDGVVCRSVQPVEREDAGWRIVRDRRRRLRLDEVALCAEEVAVAGAPALPAALTPYRRFVFGASRRTWSAVSDRLGANASDLGLDLVRAGIVTVVCKADEALQLGALLRWHLTEAGAGLAAAYAREVAEHRDATASELARSVAELQQAQHDLANAAPGPADEQTDAAGLGELTVSAGAVGSLLDALRASQPGSTRAALLAVTRDLLGGVRHESPRAFSLAHFADSKERDDVAARLADASVDADVARALGVLRAPRLGVAGQLRVCTRTCDDDATSPDAALHFADHGWDVAALAGPSLLRTDTLGLHLHLTGRDVVVLENLQAAEAVDELRRREDLPLAVLYCGGVPGEGTRALIAQAARDVPAADGRVLLCTDADFGGVRIAEAIAQALDPSALTVTRLSDIGAWPHRPQRRWPEQSESRRGLTDAVGGAGRARAAACLERGYRVEQEEAIVTAVRAWLDGEVRGTFETGPHTSSMVVPVPGTAP